MLRYFYDILHADKVLTSPDTTDKKMRPIINWNAFFIKILRFRSE